jgi:hypothetical protein
MLGHKISAQLVESIHILAAEPEFPERTRWQGATKSPKRNRFLLRETY